MPVKLGGGGGSKTYTSTTGTALETLVAGDQVRLTKTGKFIKSEDSAQPQDNRLAGGNGSTWLMTNAAGTTGTGSLWANADSVAYEHHSSGAREGVSACFLSNGYGLMWQVPDTYTWVQNYFYLTVFNITDGSNYSTGSYYQFRAYGYYGGYNRAYGGFVELKNDGTYTWVAAYRGQQQNTGTVRGGFLLIKVQNSSGYIVGVHGDDVGGNGASYFYNRSQAKYMTDTCMANDIVCHVRTEGYDAASGLTFQFRRHNIAQADANGITSPTAATATWTESMSSAYTPVHTAAGLFVLHDANRTFLLYRRLNAFNSGTTNRLQYKIITFPASGSGAYTTNVDWTTLVGSDEGGALTEQKTAQAQIVRLSDNNFAVFAATSTTVIEVQKFTWNGSAIAENGSKYTITNSKSTGWQYSSSEGNLSANLTAQYVMDRHGDGKIHLFSYGNQEGLSRYVTKLDFANSEALTVDFADVLGTGTYGDPHISQGVMNDQDGSLYFLRFTYDSNPQGIYCSKFTSAKFELGSGLTTSVVGEVSTGAAANSTATVQLFEGISSGADLADAFYVKKENMQYLLNVDGAPPTGGGVVYPTISKLAVGRCYFGGNAGTALNTSQFPPSTTSSVYVDSTSEFTLLEVIGAGSVSECYWFHGSSNNISHHTKVEIDGVIVYGSEAAYDNYAGGTKPNWSRDYAWSLQPHPPQSWPSVGVGISHPIIFKKNFKVIITGSATQTWYARASITKFTSLA